jgi:hypothetical protein
MDVDDVIDAVELQIGVEGREYLMQQLAPLPHTEVPGFLAKFRAEHALRRRGVAPALSLLEMGGVSRHAVHTAVLKAVKDELLRLIKVAADAGDQDKLADLFQVTKRYLTVEQLRDVSVAVLERVDDRTIGKEYWSEIVEEGLTNRPYIDLSTALKRRVWEVRKDAFEFEVNAVLNQIAEYVPPDEMETMMDVSHSAGMHQNKESLERLLELSNRAESAALGIIVDQFIHAAANEISENRRVAIATLFLHLFSSNQVGYVQESQATRLGRICHAAKIILGKAKEEVVKLVDLHELRILKAWISGEGSGENDTDMMEPIALLLHSTAARDMFANQLSMRLLQVSKSQAGTPGGLPAMLQRDAFLKDLTLLVLSSINAKDILESGKAVPDDEVLSHFNSFYPLLVREMRLDDEWQKNRFQVCVSLPDDGIREAMRRGCLERRVLCTYAYTLFAVDFVMGFARLRLVLDTVCAMADKPGEEREFVLALNLISLACADAP